MDNGKENPIVQKVQADHNSIAIGEINISGTVTGNIHIGHTISPLPPAETRLRNDLGILLNNVQTTWIKGVLEKSVHDAALLELGMELREEAVDNPWRMVIESPDQSREVLAPGRKIKDIFDEANHLLLILGEPGSGKTTTLLQLARDLIAEIDEAFTQPIPVILNLSTWTNKQQPLDEWMAAELSSKYRVPKKIGKKWLEDHRILPLLDGLDEVKAENREACVEQINQLVQNYGLQGVVVCSRMKDYAALNIRLEFYRAIYIQPLTVQEVDKYLAHAGDKLASLRKTLQADEDLQSLAQSPLILNIMSLAYQNTSAEALSDPALAANEARRKQLFDTYITRMFNRKAGVNEYDKKQTKQRLGWLAHNMQIHNQDVFQIENLQPSWLAERRWRLLYILVSRLIFGLVGGLIGLIGLIGWLSVSIIDILRLEWLNTLPAWKVKPHSWRLYAYTAITMLIFGLIGMIPGLILGLTSGLSGGLFLGLIYTTIFIRQDIQKSLTNDIQTVEALSWNWNKLLDGLKDGLKSGLILGLIFGLIVGLILGLGSVDIGLGSVDIGLGSGLLTGLLTVPINVLILGMISALFSGLSPKIMEAKTTPNQGIHLSTQHALYGGLIFGLIFGLIGVLISGLISGLIGGLIGALIGALIGGLAGVLLYGGRDVIQHYTLRLILIIQGHTPRDYARFLDSAVDRMFLQKVGGGYRFIHRMLLEHFAEMYEEKS